MTRDAVQASVFYHEARFPRNSVSIGTDPALSGKGSWCAKMNALLAKLTHDRDERLAFTGWLLGLERLESSKDLTIAQAMAVCKAKPFLHQLWQEYMNDRQPLVLGGG